jgi:hypothetical protein
VTYTVVTLAERLDLRAPGGEATGTLSVIEIDRERDAGGYAEPNVWTVHEV